jgi:hypothetical protein
VPIFFYQGAGRNVTSDCLAFRLCTRKDMTSISARWPASMTWTLAFFSVPPGKLWDSTSILNRWQSLPSTSRAIILTFDIMYSSHLKNVIKIIQKSVETGLGNFFHEARACVRALTRVYMSFMCACFERGEQNVVISYKNISYLQNLLLTWMELSILNVAILRTFVWSSNSHYFFKPCFLLNFTSIFNFVSLRRFN